MISLLTAGVALAESELERATAFASDLFDAAAACHFDSRPQHSSGNMILA